MPDFTQDRLHQKIKALWAETDAWQDLVEVMCLALKTQEPNNDGTDSGLSRFARLPGLCCQAVGGDQYWADGLSLAWYLFYTAADLMDSVQDQDVPDPWWVELGPAAALNAASGLYFSASKTLGDLHNQLSSRDSADEIINNFYNSFLIMSSGQQRELSNPEPSLEQYWQNTEAKSGMFFALACRNGARLATDDVTRLENLGKYGHHFGLVIQVLDDLDDVRSPEGEESPGQRPELARSLPVVYAMEVSPPTQREHLRKCLALAPIDPKAAKEVLGIIDESGAALYMMTEIERHRKMAAISLDRAEAISPAKEELLLLLQSL